MVTHVMVADQGSDVEIPEWDAESFAKTSFNSTSGGLLALAKTRTRPHHAAHAVSQRLSNGVFQDLLVAVARSALCRCRFTD